MTGVCQYCFWSPMYLPYPVRAVEKQREAQSPCWFSYLSSGSPQSPGVPGENESLLKNQQDSENWGKRLTAASLEGL